MDFVSKSCKIIQVQTNLTSLSKNLSTLIDMNEKDDVSNINAQAVDLFQI